MADQGLAVVGIARLAHQLQVLSELCESLTVRLLELEERVVQLDQQLQPALKARGAETAQIAEEAALRLDDTELRLNRLEGLLAGLQPPDWTGQSQEEPAESVESPLFMDEQLDDVFLEDDFEEDQRLSA